MDAYNVAFRIPTWVRDLFSAERGFCPDLHRTLTLGGGDRVASRQSRHQHLAATGLLVPAGIAFARPSPRLRRQVRRSAGQVRVDGDVDEGDVRLMRWLPRVDGC